MTMDEITRLVDAVTDADRSATIHGGNDRAERASAARAALLRAVEGIVGRLETETKERERCRYGWKRCAADLARETSRGNRAEERAEKAEADRDEAEDQRARAERAESVLAAARALVESELAWGLQYGDARCIWCGASPADPMEVHGDGCEFGALVRALSSAPLSPDSGERVRALEEALRKVMKAKSGTEAYETARRALSPQGDGAMSRHPVVEAAKAIIRAELDFYAATHGHRRPVTITDLTSGYDAAWRAMGYPEQIEVPTPDPKREE